LQSNAASTTLPYLAARFASTLRVENLSAARGDLNLFAGVGFELTPGDALQLTGPNGGGKTTLLRIVAGLVRQSAGTVRLNASDRANQSPDDQLQLHYLAHANAMKPQMTVRQNLTFWAKFQGGKSVADTAIENALTMIGLTRLADLPFHVLSSGQKRRTAFARLLITPAPLWLLDEPNAGLDAAATEVLEGLIDEHRLAGGIVIAATHQRLSTEASSELRDWQNLSLSDFAPNKSATT
jgi:heme exporter protein A